MNLTNTSIIADFLLKLYSSARQLSVAAFPEFAIDELKRLVDFDMGLFGLIRPDANHASGVACSWVHIHQEPTDMMEEWLSLCTGDYVLQNMLSDVGIVRSYHVPSWFSKGEDAKILDFALRTRHINLAAVSHSYGPNNQLGAFSIRRADPSWQFSAPENTLVQLLAPHIWEAIRINRTIMAGKMQGIAAEPFRGLCVSDDKGTIIFQDESFERLRLILFRDNSTYRLPEVLTKSLLVNRNQTYQDGRLTFSCKVVGDLRFLTATLNSGMDTLTKRELQVANFYGTGLTHSEIADELQLSNSTVRRHIESVYRKLQVKTKTELSVILHTSHERGAENILASLEVALQNH
ncbi:DNA-binding CsgD family transcriptional regulator [Pseudacidovorax sp. 1753]|uniref:helix-turn-helix transcriptional regulator n=1 Tax=Pseudacidovorax sp. 1753 TaxID=3156419 RepID=UPI003399DBBC